MRHLATAMAILVLATSCGGNDNSELALAEAEDKTAALAAELGQSEEALAGLVLERDELSQKVERIATELAELDEKREELAAELAEAATVATENEELRRTFNEEIVAARQLLSNEGDRGACKAGVTAARDGSKLLTAEALAAGISDDVVTQEQVVFVIAEDERAVMDKHRERFAECKRAELTLVEDEMLAAERAAFSKLLPVVCQMQQYRGFYVADDGSVTQMFQLAQFVELVYPGFSDLPADWPSADAVVAETKRCEDAPQSIIASGTYLVNEDIISGTYRSVSPVTDTCYWSRNDASGNIRANQFTESAAQIVIAVASSDYSVENEGCGILITGQLPTKVRS